MWINLCLQRVEFCKSKFLGGFCLLRHQLIHFTCHVVVGVDQITDLIRAVILNLHTKISGFQIAHFLLKLTDTFRYELGNYTDTCDCCHQTDQDCGSSNY